jgi:hypothetical protein
MLELDNTQFLTYLPEITTEQFFVGITANRLNCLSGGSCVASTVLSDGSGLCFLKVSSFVSGYQSAALPSTSFVKVFRGGTMAGDNFRGGTTAGGVWRSLAARRINKTLWCVSEARREDRGLVRQRRLYQRRRDGKAAQNSRRGDGGYINSTNCRSLLVMEWSCPF